MASLEDRISALEARVASYVSDAEPTLPTYLQVDPNTGKVTAIFTGGVQLTESTTGATPLPPSALEWVDALGVLREYIQGYGTPAAGHQLTMVSQPDASDFAALTLFAVEDGAAGSASLVAQARDSTLPALNPGGLVTLIDSLSRSGFLQGGYLNPPIVTQPTRGFFNNYTPNVDRPTLVTMNVQVNLTPGAIATVEVDVNVGPDGYTEVNQTYNNGTASNLVIPGCYTFLVPPNQIYQAQASTSGGSVTLLSTTEKTL